MLLFSQRRQLHRSIAAWYEETFFANPSTVYPLLAYQWSRAGEADRAVNALERAGEQALRSGAYREAVSFLLERLRSATVPARGVTAPAERRGAPAGRRNWARPISASASWRKAACTPSGR